MDALIQTGQYIFINTTDITKMGYYVIKFLSEYYSLQEDTTCNGKISKVGDLFFKSQYMSCMKYNTNRYWVKLQQQNNIIVTTHIIVHPCLYVMSVTELKQIPKSVWDINQARNTLQRHTIYITDYDCDYILDEIKCGYNVGYEIYISVVSNR